MLLRTHIAAAMIVGLFFEPAGLAMHASLAYFLVILIATLLPDIDHENSRIGHAYPSLSLTTNKIFGHRGLFHAFVFPVVLWWIMSAYIAPLYGAALLIGMMTHLACDCLTVQGVAVFRPFSAAALG